MFRLKCGFVWLGLKAVTGPDSAKATEITKWVRTEFTENTGNYDLRIPGLSAVTVKDEKKTIYISCLHIIVILINLFINFFFLFSHLFISLFYLCLENDEFISHIKIMFFVTVVNRRHNGNGL